MNKEVEMVMNVVHSMIQPEIMTTKEKLDFLTMLENRVWELKEAILDDLRKT